MGGWGPVFRTIFFWHLPLLWWWTWYLVDQKWKFCCQAMAGCRAGRNFESNSNFQQKLSFCQHRHYHHYNYHHHPKGLFINEIITRGRSWGMIWQTMTWCVWGVTIPSTNDDVIYEQHLITFLIGIMMIICSYISGRAWDSDGSWQLRLHLGLFHICPVNALYNYYN